MENSTLDELRAKVLLEISDNWNIEAKQESTDYFYSTGESQQLLTGKNILLLEGRVPVKPRSLSTYPVNTTKVIFLRNCHSRISHLITCIRWRTLDIQRRTNT